MGSGLLGLTPDVWIALYDNLLKIKNLPDIAKERLEAGKLKILAIYKWIEGEWWKRGWRRVYYLENFFGKASYEINQELKVFPIIQEDLDFVKETMKVRR